MATAQDGFRRRGNPQSEPGLGPGCIFAHFDNNVDMPNHKQAQVVMLGAGFGGLTFCQQFHHAGAQLTVVDRTNHDLFQPLLYQVATAGLSAPEIAQPVRSILSARRDITVLLDQVRELNLAERWVQENPDLSLRGRPEVFAIGDMALVLGENDRPVPGVSPAAMQMAKPVAQIIGDELDLGAGRAPRPPFKYWDRGTMATIGRSAAVASVGKLRFSGLLAWLFVHLIFLVGFRNKLAVLLQWSCSYFACQRSADHHQSAAGAIARMMGRMERSAWLNRDIFAKARQSRV